MKTYSFILLILGLSLIAHGRFEVRTPEQARAEDKAAKKWETSIRREYDLTALHKFLVATITDQKRKDDVDLTVSRVDEKWKVMPYQRMLLSRDWFFIRDENGKGFQLRYYYGKENDVVFVCERLKQDAYRLIEVRLERASFELMLFNRPNQPLLPTSMSVTDCAYAHSAPDTLAADL